MPREFPGIPVKKYFFKKNFLKDVFGSKSMGDKKIIFFGGSAPLGPLVGPKKFFKKKIFFRGQKIFFEKIKNSYFCPIRQEANFQRKKFLVKVNLILFQTHLNLIDLSIF